MKVPDKGIKRRGIKLGMILLVLAVMGLNAGSVLAASDSEGAKGWVETDTFRVINFLVLAGALFYVLRKPAAKALNDRIKGIEDQLNELQAKKAEAEKELAEYNKKFALLDKEAENILADYHRQGQEAKARIVDAAKTTAEKLEEQARRNIEKEYERTKGRLQQELMDEALVRAEQIIKAKISDQDQEKLVDEYLAKVVA